MRVRYKAVLAALVIAVGAIVGCTSTELENVRDKVDSEVDRYRTAKKMYVATMDSLTDFRQAGKLSPETIDKVNKYKDMATTGLRKWGKLLKAEGPTKDARQKALRGLNVLQEILLEQRGASDANGN